jgi:predicted dienelactone hydrolase
VTPYPVVGYIEFPFFDEFHQQTRSLLVWYPVEPLTAGEESPNEWDLFKVALNAPIASSKEKMPVVIISYGYGGTPHQLSWLIKHLIYNNYIVLATQHLDLQNGKPHGNHWQRPKDIHTIIDLFSSKALSSSANLNKIGMAGFSLGGTTAIWLVGGRATKLETIAPGSDYASPEEFRDIDLVLPSLDRDKMSQDWRDNRIKAAFIMAPAWAWIFDEQSLKAVSIPTYVIASSADNVLVTSNNAGFFAKNIPGSSYQTISGEANHYVFISALNEIKRKKANFPPKLNFLIEDSPTVDRNWIQFQVAEEAVNFFNQEL